MARYSKVSRRIWRDEKFNKLTASQPCGQALFLWLLTSPHLDCIPGVICIGEAAMAEELGWSKEGFDIAFREVLTEGFVKFDKKARLLFCPNAIRYNIPESPKVVIGWRDAWDLVPECALKIEIYQTFKSFLEGYSKAFGEAFGKAIAKPFRKAMPYQEQEQEQLSIISLSVEDNGGGGPKIQDGVSVAKNVKRKLKADEIALWEFWRRVHRKNNKHVIDNKRLTAMCRALENHPLLDLKKAVIGCSNSPHHMGQNDRNTKYNDIELICRDEKHFSDFIRLYRPGDERDYDEDFSGTV